MYWTGSTCAVIPSQCPAQLVWNDQQNRCVPSNNVCPSGTYFNGFSCMPYSGCKNGQIWSNALVQCVCPENSFWNGGNCVPCVGGMLYGASGCYCPLGSFFNGTACSKVATKECSSIAYSVLNGQICDCLPGFDKVEESCICTGVVIGLNFCDKCTLKPNSQWNGIICQCNSDYVEVLGRCKPKSETTNPTGVVPANRPRNRCSVGTFFDGFEQKCQLCSDGCLSCKDCYQCQQCRPEYTFHAATKTCLEICGDGKRFSLQCDDGNNVNGDGCSSDCKIEPEYTCSAGSPNSKDLCSKFKPEKI
jgi:cysteine-rich repeat protein